MTAFRPRYACRRRKAYVCGCQCRQVLEQLAFQRYRDLVGGRERQGVIDRDRDVRVELLADPARFRLDYLHPGNVLGGVTDFIDYADGRPVRLT